MGMGGFPHYGEVKQNQTLQVASRFLGSCCLQQRQGRRGQGGWHLCPCQAHQQAAPPRPRGPLPVRARDRCANPIRVYHLNQLYCGFGNNKNFEKTKKKKKKKKKKS